MLKINILAVLLLFGLAAFAQNRQLSGTVKEEGSGNGVSAATISIKGSSKASASDADGKFRITVPNGKATLQVSAVGFVTKDVQVDAGTNDIVITLAQGNQNLTEVVVTALGIKRNKASLTYASQTVGGDELRKASNTNFVDALSGKAAGLDIKVSGSGAGGSTKAVLRGNKSLTGLSEALYVIDGIPLVNNKNAQPGSYGGTDGGDGLSSINPADIESINVLRGANAAILYGSQGANGVILITTKKGRSGRMSVDFNSSTIFEQVSGLPQFQYRYGTSGKGDYSWIYPDMTKLNATDLINIQKSPVVNVTSGNYQKTISKIFSGPALLQPTAYLYPAGMIKRPSIFPTLIFRQRV